MPREPISAAEKITFLDKEQCEHCEFWGTKREIAAHATLQHRRRKMDDDFRKEKIRTSFEEAYRIRILQLYERQAISKEDALARLEGISGA